MRADEAALHHALAWMTDDEAKYVVDSLPRGHGMSPVQVRYVATLASQMIRVYHGQVSGFQPFGVHASG